MKKITCHYLKLFNYYRAIKLAVITFFLAGMFVFSSYAYAGVISTLGDPEGVSGEWSVSPPESSTPDYYYLLATTPGTPSITPSSPSICSGNSTQLTANSSNATYVYWYTGSCGGTFIGSVNNNSGKTLSPTSTTTYWVRGWNAGAGFGSCQTVTVTVNAPPTAPTSAGGDKTICSGSSTTLTASGGTPGSGCTYQWYAGGCGSGSVLGTSSTLNVSPTATTTYYVRRVGNTACTTVTGCASAKVTVNSNPTAPTSVSVSPTPVCSGTSTTYTLNYSGGSAGGSGGTFYWYEGSCGGTVVGTGQNKTITQSLTSSTTYYGRWVSNSCGNSGCESATVTVNPKPTALVLNGSYICASPGGTGTITSTTSVSGVNYQLYNSSNSPVQSAKAGTGSGLSWSGLAAGDGYYVIGNDGSCTSQSNSVNVGAYSMPTTPTSAAVNPAIACAGNSTTYTLTYSGGSAGGSGGTLRWYEGGCGSGSSIGTGNNVTITRTLTGNTNFYCRWESNSCGVSSCASATVEFTGNPVPTASPASICPGGSTTLSASSPNSTIYWYSGSCNGVFIASGNPITVAPSSNTTYYAYALTSVCSSGCGSVTITIDANAAVTSVTGLSPLCSGNTTTYTANGVVLGGGTGAWSSSNTSVATVNSSGVVTAVGPGTTNITYTISGGCGGTKSASQELTVNQAPTFTTCPSNISLNTASEVCTASTTYTVSASGTPTPTYSYSFSGATTGGGNGSGSGATFNKGVTNVVVTATNSCGSTTCNFSITVTDNEVPVITCPTVAASYNADAGKCYAAMSFEATATDNCGVSGITYKVGASSITFPYNFAVGSTTVTATATDVNGLTSNCNFTVVVFDNQAPVADLTPLPTLTGECSVMVSTAPTATDNCAGTITGTTTDPMTYTAQGSYTITWTSDDGNGNTSTQTQTVAVEDITSPDITCPSDVTVNCQDDNSSLSTGLATATDICTPEA
ncbi:MAG: HYR domain-containing protein, partial [Bacteroidales bacterium]|nr:HYR domain-containing protein [Bacteroidales bacterium]